MTVDNFRRFIMVLLLLLISLNSAALGWIPRSRINLRMASSSSSISKSQIDRLSVQANTAASAQKWWSKDREGLTFGCTGCGRCCQNEGVVWLDTDEFAELCDSLQLTHEQVLDTYTDEIMSGWVKLKNKPGPNAALDSDRCIFLDDDGRKCTIYESRPVQCRTYPYWPKLLFNSSSFDAQAVAPDDAPVGPYWSAKNGGCEGINHANSTVVETSVIARNSALYDTYIDSFPFMASGDDRQRLLDKVDIIKRIAKSTKAWVKEFVLKYSLCPFAGDVYASDRIRYRVHFGGTDSKQIIERVRYEMMALLTAKEEDVATTLLVLPFAFANFNDFYDFSLDLEDAILPLIEKELRGPSPNRSISNGENAGGTNGSKRKRLLQKVQQEKESKCPVPHGDAGAEGPLPDIQLAFFHPQFSWSDSEEYNDPLNFEKRAPFPTINLLRAARVREWASTSKTTKIAKSNAAELSNAGADQLSAEFESIIRLAL